MLNILIDGTNLSLDLLESQKYKNMEVIPVRINCNGNRDYLTLKRGIKAGFVEITECEVSTVGTVLAKNNSNVPLILIDGDEILGAKQNRIMNRSLIIPPRTSMKVSVSCTEQGRWHYERANGISFDGTDEFIHFDCSEEAADFSTRRAKSADLFENRSCQSTVWNSINDLERRTSFRSGTSALHDNFLNHRPRLNEYLNNFRLEYGQSGAIFIINGQIKGLELFANPSIYHDYHEKKEVRIYRTTKSAKRGVYYGCNGSDYDYSPLVNAEKHLANLDGGEHHQSRGDHVEHYSEIYRTESAQEGGGLPRIAQFVELDVALRAGTHPQLRIDKHRHHAGQQKRPPLPVFAETRIPDEFGEHVRGIRGCGCGAHGHTDKPPRH